MMRWADTTEAYRNVVRLSPPDAANLSDYGEAQVMANQGIVPAAAHAVFAQALAIDPGFPKARFYDALALKQEGKTAEAKAAFEAFLQRLRTSKDKSEFDAFMEDRARTTAAQDAAEAKPAADGQTKERPGEY